MKIGYKSHPRLPVRWLAGEQPIIGDKWHTTQTLTEREQRILAATRSHHGFNDVASDQDELTISRFRDWCAASGYEVHESS